MVQLLGCRPDTPQALLDLRSYKDTGRTPTGQLLDEALRGAMRDFDNVYVVLDGLDECPNADDATNQLARDERKAILRLISFLRDWELDNLHLAVVSRPEGDISYELERQSVTRMASSYTIDLSTKENSNQVDNDMLTYISAELEAAKFRSVTLDMRERIKTTLIAKAHGMQVRSHSWVSGRH